MSTINIAINATLADFSQFVDDLGYQAQVIKSPDELALLVEPISVQDRLKPNPQTKTDYLLAYFRQVVLTELVRVKNLTIQSQIDTAKENQKAAIRTAINSAIVVTAS